MNISHTGDSKQHQTDEYEYTKAFLKNISGEHAENKSSNSAITKILELLDDTTPNYVLGYN